VQRTSNNNTDQKTNGGSRKNNQAGLGPNQNRPQNVREKLGKSAENNQTKKVRVSGGKENRGKEPKRGKKRVEGGINEEKRGKKKTSQNHILRPFIIQRRTVRVFGAGANEGHKYKDNKRSGERMRTNRLERPENGPSEAARDPQLHRIRNGPRSVWKKKTRI